MNVVVFLAIVAAWMAAAFIVTKPTRKEIKQLKAAGAGGWYSKSRWVMIIFMFSAILGFLTGMPMLGA